MPLWWRAVIVLGRVVESLGLPFDWQAAHDVILRRSRWRVRGAAGRCGRWHTFGDVDG